jgi:adenylate cyclase
MRVAVSGMAIGSIYGVLLNLATRGGPRLGAPIGAIHGFILSSTIATLEVFGTRTRVGRAVEQAPFLVTLLVKGLVYGSLIALVNVTEPGTRLFRLPVDAGSVQLVSVFFSFGVIWAVLFVLQISRIIGGRTLRDWVLGRYHRPRQEERFFLFVDIVGSTALAERVGPVAVHAFLNRVFVLASDPVDDHRGEIYQYVGDEMVITWSIAAGVREARPIHCFLAIEATLHAASVDFVRDFGLAPHVRGALHVGHVVVGEVGAQKRDIVFHGDVMNTTSRLEQIARELDRRLVVSADALDRLSGPHHVDLEDLGAQTLRGRTSPLRIYASPRSRD